MRKIYAIFAAAMTSLSLQAQVTTYCAQRQPASELQGDVLKTMLMKQHSLFLKSTAQDDAEQVFQNPKWLTNLPVDSAIFRQEFIPYEEGTTAWFSTVYYDNLTKYFVGNRIKKIRTLIPEFASNITVWIKDVGGDKEVILWESTLADTVKTNEIIDVPCDLLLDKAYKLQVGFNFTVTKTNPVFPAVVPCNRTESWIQGHSGTAEGRPLDYTTMRNFIYGDPHPYYGYYFHCITEGDAGLPDYDLNIRGVSHNRVALGTDTECHIQFESYGAKSIDNLTFKSETSIETKSIAINQPVSYLGYGNFTTTAKAAAVPSRMPLKIHISEIDGQPVTQNLGAEGSIVAIHPEESYPRKVVMEEFTGTWCGWCPRGMKSIEMLNEEFGEQFIPIGIHFNDKMQTDYFFDVVKYSDGSFPGATLNRSVKCEPYYGTSHNNSPFYVVNDVEKMMNSLTEASITMDQLTFDTKTNKVSVTTTTQFNIECNMEAYAISYVVTEDSVKDVQTNYYSFNKDNPKAVEEDMRELTQKPERWLTALHHVARKSYETLGVAGSVGKDIQRFVPQHFTYEFELPANVKNKKNLHIVALLLDTKSGEIINACQQHISKAEVTGIAPVVPALAADVAVNGTTLSVSAEQATLKVYDPNGRLMVNEQISGTVDLQPGKGVFVVRLEKGNQILVKKVVL